MRTGIRSLPIAALAFAVYCGNVYAHDESLNCTPTAASQAAIESARAELKQKPKSASIRVGLSDKLVAVGCYDEAIHVLEDGVKASSGDRVLQSRLETARSFIKEREYLEKRPTTMTIASSAEFLRAQLRCKQIGDLPACDLAVAVKPDDGSLWVAKGDALLKEKRSQEALLAFNRAKQLSTAAAPIDVAARISAAQAMIGAGAPIDQVATAAPQASVRTAAVQPARKYSNIEPAGRSN